LYSSGGAVANQQELSYARQINCLGTPNRDSNGYYRSANSVFQKQELREYIQEAAPRLTPREERIRAKMIRYILRTYKGSTIVKHNRGVTKDQITGELSVWFNKPSGTTSLINQHEVPGV